jgi:hypothetical protein
MGFDLTGLFSRQTQVNSNAAALQQTQAAKENAGQNAARNGQNLSVGSVISGQVVKLSGDTVQIEISPGQLLNAKVEAGAVFQEGTTASFEVSSVSKDQIALRTLFQNTASNADTISRALQEAQIPVSGEAATMVHTMMENGMAIDKESLQAMYRQAVAHPEISSETVVSMDRLQLPLTDANIAQFQSYQNLEHQIVRSVETVMDSLQENVLQLVGEGKLEEAVVQLQINCDRKFCTLV